MLKHFNIICLYCLFFVSHSLAKDIDSIIVLTDFWTGQKTPDSMVIKLKGKGLYDISYLNIKIFSSNYIIFEQTLDTSTVHRCSWVDEYLDKDEIISDSLISYYSNGFKEHLNRSIDEIRNAKSTDGIKILPICFCAIPGCEILKWNRKKKEFVSTYKP